jgi:pseudouridine synthase
MISSGRVTVNKARGVLGQMITPERDVVKLDGKVYAYEERFGEGHKYSYYKYYKPKGEECTSSASPSSPSSSSSSSRKRTVLKSVSTLLRSDSRLFTLGRLDKDTTGIIIVTDDGTLSDKVLKSEGGKEKKYICTTQFPASARQIEMLTKGVKITTLLRKVNGGERILTDYTKPAVVQKVGPSKLHITITEGRNRQIHKMIETVGLGDVLSLKRVTFCGIGLDGLDGEGCIRKLKKVEKDLLIS